MIQLDIRSDLKKVEIYLRALGKGAPRATSRALNRTATTVRVDAARLLQEKRDLNISVIKKAMRIKRATVQNLVAEVVVSGRSISIRNFSRLSFERINGKNVGIRGVSIRILKGSRARIAKRFGNKAFTNPRIGGGLPIVVRTSKKRYPLEAWPPVPGLPTVLVQEKIAEALKRVARDAFVKRIQAEIKYEIEVAKKAA